MTAGSIVRLKLQRFMTYEFMEIKPCPGLNLITGPNGSGKSTLLCAMCLSLAGKPSNIGRSEKISDYIKTGYDNAYVEIELLNPDGRNIVIGRLINSSNNSNWTLNGKTTSQKMIEREIARFNIQTNNLCQFLPQEKVADFTKMNQKELLESTEQAVGDQSMYDNHTKLKQLRAQYCESENSLNSLKENLEREVEKNQRLEGEVKQHKEREKHQKRIESIRKKIPWMKYQTKRDEYVAKQEEKRKLKEEHDKNSTMLDPLREDINQLTQQLRKTEKDTDLVDKEIRTKKQMVSAAVQKLDEIDTKISDSKYCVSERIKAEKDRVQNLQNGHTVLRNLENEYREAQTEDEENQRKLKALSEEEKRIHFDHLEASASITRSRDNKTLLQRNINDIKREIENQQQQQRHRFNTLKAKEPDAFEAVIWLRENQHMFKKKIYEPILTLINVSNPQAVKYIENNISYRDLMAFYAEDRGDMDLFLKTLSDNRGLDISGIHKAEGLGREIRPKMSLDQLRKFGLTHYLNQLFTAPPVVMSYLCDMYSLHNIPVRFDFDRNVVRQLHGNRNFPFSKFYVGDYMFRLKTSKYGARCQSSTSQKIMESGLLRGSVDTTKIEALNEKMKGLQNSLRDEDGYYMTYSANEKKCAEQIEKLRAEKKKLFEKRDALKNLSAKITSYKDQLKFAETPVCNIEDEEQRLAQIVAGLNQEKIKVHAQLNILFEEIIILEKEKLKKNLSHFFLLKKKEETEKSLKNASAELHALQRTISELVEQIRKLKGEVQIALNEAKKTVGLRLSDEIPQELKESIDREFQGLPDAVGKLEIELAREQAKLNCINNTNPSIMQEFLTREARITKTKETIAAKEQELQELDANINSIRDQWLPAIETLIEKISANFSRYFASLGCAGEVTLDKTDNPNDFEKYGLSIKVKFRDEEPLNQLSHAHHSGGECSVSTILYILSLQELTEVPFRCVDEINQGMDNNNERNVFDLIVKSSCSKKKSQYFLITPKLLHGLEYPPEMEIAIIHNGLSKKCSWNIDKFVRIKESSENSCLP